MNGTIYALLDPRTGEHRYIGQTQNSPYLRLRGHINGSKFGNSHCKNWLQQVLAEGQRPRLVILQEGLETQGAVHKAERQWITLGLTRGWRLTNATEGGEQSPMLIPEIAAKAITNSIETRQTPEYGALRSTIALNLWKDPAYRKRLSDAHTGYKPTGKGSRGRLADPSELNPMHNQETVAKGIATRKQNWNLEKSNRNREMVKKLWDNLEYRRKQTIAHGWKVK